MYIYLIIVNKNRWFFLQELMKNFHNFADVRGQVAKMAEYLASIFGTEKDKVNCSFYFKMGACTHGDRCSRIHNKPTFSQVIDLLAISMMICPSLKEISGTNNFVYDMFNFHYRSTTVFDRLNFYRQICIIRYIVNC